MSKEEKREAVTLAKPRKKMRTEDEIRARIKELHEIRESWLLSNPEPTELELDCLRSCISELKWVIFDESIYADELEIAKLKKEIKRLNAQVEIMRKE